MGEQLREALAEALARRLQGPTQPLQYVGSIDERQRELMDEWVCGYQGAVSKAIDPQLILNAAMTARRIIGMDDGRRWRYFLTLIDAPAQDVAYEEAS